jgi:hypothetical protein
MFEIQKDLLVGISRVICARRPVIKKIHVLDFV